MIGLRAQRPETRARFFALYDGAVGRRLFDRLRFIILEQDWERLSHTFWLKQAMVRIVMFNISGLGSVHHPGAGLRAPHPHLLADTSHGALAGIDMASRLLCDSQTVCTAFAAIGPVALQPHSLA